MFFLDGVISDKNDVVNNVIAILRARGFLIEEIEGRYYLSDNASVDDVFYLSSLLERFEVGTVIDDKNYSMSSRKVWDKEALSISYKYKSLKPKHVEILVNKNSDLNSVFRLFSCMGQNGTEVPEQALQWRQFAVETLGTKVCVSFLEGYVAFYVKAVSACGVYTSYSCDGNHKNNGGKIFVYAKYPSDIWHEFLWEYIVCREFGAVDFIGKGIAVIDSNMKRKVYSLLYDISVYLYCNRIEIRKIKVMTVQNIKKSFLKRHTQNEVEDYYRMECRRVLSDERNYKKLISRKEVRL